MDDTIRTIDHDRYQQKRQDINSFHPNLQFTMEIEADNELPFLDMKLIHIDNQLNTTCYCKSTGTGVVMNSHALAPKR